VVTGLAEANKLEHWFQSLPRLVQDTLHEPFDWMNSALKAVAGNPDTLLAAVPQYMAIAEAVHQSGEQQAQDRMALAGHWQGDAYHAFTDRMQHIEAQLDRLAETIRHVKEVLEAGAHACVESANMIIDLVTSMIMFALSTIAVNVALSVITVGTSLAAGVAMVVGKAITTAAQVVRVLEKTAEILNKLAQVFFKMQRLLRQISQIIQEIQEVLKDAQALTKTAQGWDKIGAKVSFGLQKTVVSKGIALGTGGAVSIPGGGSGLYHAGQNYLDGRQHASDAQDQAPR
jgi:uncharacterized protein YukE